MSEEIAKYKLPKGWVWAKLSDISLPVERVNSKYENAAEKFKYIDIESINNNLQNIKASKDYTWDTAPSRAQQKIETNDILFATVRPYLKNIAVVTPEYNGQIASSGFCIIRPYLVSHKYIFYYVSSESFVKSVNKLAKGTSYPAVTNRIILDQEIPLPPLEEQHRIVSKIEELFSGLDISQGQLQSALKQLEAYKQSILKYTFQTDNYSLFKKLDEILLFLGSGVTPKGGKQTYSDSGVMFLRSQNIYANKLELKNVAYITVDTHKKMKRSQVKPLDVLLNITGASIGRCAYVPDNFNEANVNQHVCILRPNAEEVFYKYLSIFLNSPEAQNTIMKLQTGATRQGLNYSQIKSINIPLPDINRQKDIVIDIEQKNTICDKIQESIKEGLREIETFRQAIMKKAFLGILVEQIPGENSATELIQIIQSAKTAYTSREKERQKLKIIPMADKPKSIIDILRDHADEMSSKQVWLSSIHKESIDEFYAELKKCIESGDVIELPRKGKESVLKLIIKK